MLSRPLFLSVVLAFVLLLPASVTWAAAADQSRPLPPDATVGWLQMSAMPSIVIDEQPHKLSAAAQIRNQKNLIVQVSSLSGKEDVPVLYQTNKIGQVVRMWLLTDVEYQRIHSGEKQSVVTPMPSQH